MDDIETALLTTTKLQERGWTPTLIKKFLGEPDDTQGNPLFHAAAPMRLYARDRVQTVEQTSDFQQAHAKSIARSKAGKAVAARKAEELIAQAESLPITVKVLSIDLLLQKAIDLYKEYYSALAFNRGEVEYKEAHEDSDSLFLTRIVVNYIRHHLTEYDNHLEEVVARIGVHQATDVIRNRIYEAITSAYPDFAAECDRQMYRRGLSHG